MINLTGAKVGDKFNGNKGGVLELALKGKCGDFVLIDEESGQIIVTDSNGDGTNCSWEDVVSKVDPRPWLKDLPDADLFSELVGYLYYDAGFDGWGYGYKIPLVCEVDERYMPLKMPTLTGDQWKDSKISIKDLKAWQLANQ